MADEFVTIKIKVNADTKDIKRVNRELTQMGVNARLASNSTGNLANAMNSRFDPAARKMKSRLLGIASMLSTINKLALKVFAVTFVVAAASLASVNALFAVGKFAIQAYRVAMQGLAVGVTAVGAGLAVVAAAQREYNAALYAYSYKASPALGKGLNQSRASLRMLQTDARLSVFGMEALNASFATLSRSGQVTGRTVGALRAFADFAAAGGDPTKNLQGIAEVLAMIEKDGKLTSAARSGASSVNQAFADALEEASNAGKTSYSDLVDFIENSGVKARMGIEGQSELLGNTLVGKFKRFTTAIVGLFADIGQPLLGPVSEAFEKMFRIIRLGILRLAPDFIEFGSGRMLDGLVSAVQKLTDGFVNLTRKYLAGSEGMLKRFNHFWEKTVFVFNRVVESMRPLLEGGRAVMDIFGPVFGEFFGKIGDILKQLNKLITGNRDEWEKFGQTLKDLITTLGDFIMLMFEVFNRALPILTPIITAFNDLARGIMRVVESLSSLPGALSVLNPLAAFASMFGLLFAGKGLKNMARFGQSGRDSRSKFRQGVSNLGSNASQMGSNAMYFVTGGRGGGPTPTGDWRNQSRPSAYRDGRSVGFTRGQSMQYARTFPNAAPPRFLGGIGPGLGMGLMTPFVDEKAQGGMVAGSVLASLAPMLGKYGPYAALAGMGIGGFSVMSNARTAGGGALGGAMAGLGAGGMAGAAIGAFGGPIGMVGGMLIGTAAGAIVGAIQGRSRGEKAKVQKITEQATGELYNTVANSMVAGNTGGARNAIEASKENANRLMAIYNESFKNLGGSRQLRKDMADDLLAQGKISQEEAKAFANAPGTFAKGMQEAALKTEEYLNGPLDRYDKVVGILQETTGKSAEEIKRLANELGVNLYDDSVAIRDVLADMGAAMRKTADEIRASARDLALSSLGIFDEAITRLDATSVLDDSADSMRELLISGSAIDKDYLEFVKSWGETLMVLNPDKPLQSIQELFDLFGEGGFAFEPGQVFEGFGPEFAKVIGPYLEQLLGQRPEFVSQMAQEISQGFLERGKQVNVKALEAAINRGDLDFQQLGRLNEAVASGAIFGNQFASPETALNAILSSLGITQNIGLKNVPMDEGIDLATLQEDEITTRKQFFEVVTGFFETKPDWMTNMPPWWTQIGGAPVSASPTNNGNKNQNGFKADDTVSSRLSRTLGRHAYLNSKIHGNRSITSAFRTNNLGSINSDHVTGNAYDLTGQNLGAYSKMVNSMGGFAEFHGYGGTRHLHVVPGETPMGDTSLPSMTKSNPVSTANTNNSYSIVVNGGGDSAERIARRVMDEIARSQRSARERR